MLQRRAGEWEKKDESRKPKAASSQNETLPAGLLGSWAGGLVPASPRAVLAKNFSHRAISFACVRCRCFWPQLQLQLQLLFLQLLIK